MRIVGGELRGRRIRVQGGGIRPTSERVREALMSVLGDRLDAGRVLDGFAGTGAFGFEALSRGVDHVVFVEQNGATCRRLQETAEEFQVLDRVTTHRGDCTRVMRRLARDRERFDLMFFDPPWGDADLLEAALSKAAELCAPGALILAEQSVEASTPEEIGRVHKVDRRVWGGTQVAFYERIG